MHGWYWRAIDATRNMTIAQGTSETRDGVVEQIATCLRHSPYVMASFDGHGIEIIIQKPVQRPGTDL